MVGRESRWRNLWPGVLFLVAAGCGVAAYEDKMYRSEQRQKRFEEETKFLDGPLVVPAANPKASPPNVFLRAPKGINTSPANEKEPRNGILFSYAGRQGANSAFDKMDVAVGSGKTFAEDVLKAYGSPGSATRSEKVIRPFDREPLTFARTTFEDGPYFYSANVLKGDTQVAVVFYLLRPKAGGSLPQNWEQAIDTSLSTVAVGADVNKQREVSMRSPLFVPGHPR